MARSDRSMHLTSLKLTEVSSTSAVDGEKCIYLISAITNLRYNIRLSLCKMSCATLLLVTKTNIWFWGLINFKTNMFFSLKTYTHTKELHQWKKVMNVSGFGGISSKICQRFHNLPQSKSYTKKYFDHWEKVVDGLRFWDRLLEKNFDNKDSADMFLVSNATVWSLETDIFLFSIARATSTLRRCRGWQNFRKIFPYLFQT